MAVGDLTFPALATCPHHPTWRDALLRPEHGDSRTLLSSYPKIADSGWEWKAEKPSACDGCQLECDVYDQLFADHPTATTIPDAEYAIENIYPYLESVARQLKQLHYWAIGSPADQSTFGRGGLEFPNLAESWTTELAAAANGSKTIIVKTAPAGDVIIDLKALLPAGTNSDITSLQPGDRVSRWDASGSFYRTCMAELVSFDYSNYASGSVALTLTNKFWGAEGDVIKISREYADPEGWTDFGQSVTCACKEDTFNLTEAYWNDNKDGTGWVVFSNERIAYPLKGTDGFTPTFNVTYNNTGGGTTDKTSAFLSGGPDSWAIKVWHNSSGDFFCELYLYVWPDDVDSIDITFWEEASTGTLIYPTQVICEHCRRDYSNSVATSGHDGTGTDGSGNDWFCGRIGETIPEYENDGVALTGNFVPGACYQTNCPQFQINRLRGRNNLAGTLGWMWGASNIYFRETGYQSSDYVWGRSGGVPSIMFLAGDMFLASNDNLAEGSVTWFEPGYHKPYPSLYHADEEKRKGVFTENPLVSGYVSFGSDGLYQVNPLFLNRVPFLGHTNPVDYGTLFAGAWWHNNTSDHTGSVRKHGCRRFQSSFIGSTDNPRSEPTGAGENMVQRHERGKRYLPDVTVGTDYTRTGIASATFEDVTIGGVEYSCRLDFDPKGSEWNNKILGGCTIDSANVDGDTVILNMVPEWSTFLYPIGAGYFKQDVIDYAYASGETVDPPQYERCTNKGLPNHRKKCGCVYDKAAEGDVVRFSGGDLISGEVGQKYYVLKAAASAGAKFADAEEGRDLDPPHEDCAGIPNAWDEDGDDKRLKMDQLTLDASQPVVGACLKAAATNGTLDGQLINVSTTGVLHPWYTGVGQVPALTISDNGGAWGPVNAGDILYDKPGGRVWIRKITVDAWTGPDICLALEAYFFAREHTMPAESIAATGAAVGAFRWIDLSSTGFTGKVLYSSAQDVASEDDVEWDGITGVSEHLGHTPLGSEVTNEWRHNVQDPIKYHLAFAGSSTFRPLKNWGGRPEVEFPGASLTVCDACDYFEIYAEPVTNCGILNIYGPLRATSPMLGETNYPSGHVFVGYYPNVGIDGEDEIDGRFWHKMIPPVGSPTYTVGLTPYSTTVSHFTYVSIQQILTVSLPETLLRIGYDNIDEVWVQVKITNAEIVEREIDTEKYPDADWYTGPTVVSTPNIRLAGVRITRRTDLHAEAVDLTWGGVTSPFPLSDAAGTWKSVNVTAIIKAALNENPTDDTMFGFLIVGGEGDGSGFDNTLASQIRHYLNTFDLSIVDFRAEYGGAPDYERPFPGWVRQHSVARYMTYDGVQIRDMRVKVLTPGESGEVPPLPHANYPRLTS